MFESIPEFPGDPIFSLLEVFAADPRPNKINLSIGVYHTEDGKVPLLPVVKKADEEILKEGAPWAYLPMDGLVAFRQAVQKLIFGSDIASLASRLATVQTIGGSGALKVGADFLKRFFPKSDIWICDPTWDNHHTIFRSAGIACHTYPYFDAMKREILFKEMLESLCRIPEGGIVLLQPCCHNPTGADLDEAQWRQVFPILKERKLIPFMDIAYQGFGRGMEEDAFAIRELVKIGVPFFLSCSFSKNMSLYGERCGALILVCENQKEAERVQGQLKACIRAIYSSPPSHGAKIAAKILLDDTARAEWISYVDGMRARIRKTRQDLYDALKKRSPQHNFDYLIKQTGMFSYTGLSEGQIDKMRDHYGVYLVRTGRICIASIKSQDIETIADAFVAVLQSD